MRISSKDIPQADILESVILATVAIANGARTDLEIADSIPTIVGDDRQGRYYRKAAEILGFITNHRNNAQITQKGRDLVNDARLTNPIILSSVLNLNLYQKLIPYLELHPQGLTRQEVITYLQSISDPRMGQTMIPRRIATIISWIRSLGIIRISNDRYVLNREVLSELPVFSINDITQPILPSSGDLIEYNAIENRVAAAGDMITIYKDQARLDRANQAHTDLVNLVAARIREAGSIPKSNQFIDLATARDEGDYIFEMKSITNTNIASQVRRGISQLYEYRYIQNKTNANLILVIESPLQGRFSWMEQYLENDRDIYLVWDGDGQLHARPQTREALRFLNIQAVN